MARQARRVAAESKATAARKNGARGGRTRKAAKGEMSLVDPNFVERGER